MNQSVIKAVKPAWDKVLCRLKLQENTDTKFKTMISGMLRLVLVEFLLVLFAFNIVTYQHILMT
jgi:hypothetical protein